MSKIISQETKNKIVEYYKSFPKTIKNTAIQFNLSIPTIMKILDEYSIPRWTKQDLNNIGTKEDFFEIIDTEEKAYFLGLIITDGCVFVNKYKNNSALLSIQLQEKDAYMITLFKEILKANRKVVIDKRDNSASITIISNKIVSDLGSYGVVPRKTFKTYLPSNISKNLMPHLIRGILDGDGSIGIRSTHYGKQYRPQIAFCGNYDLIAGVRDFLVKEINISEPKIVKEENIYSIRWGKISDCISIGDYLYNNSHLFLKRKHEKFLHIKSLFYGNAEITV